MTALQRGPVVPKDGPCRSAVRQIATFISAVRNIRSASIPAGRLAQQAGHSGGMTWKAVDGCARSRGPEAVLRPPRYFSPGGFRIGSAARHRAQARGGQGEDQADPQQQIGLGFGDRRPSRRTANLSAWRRRPRCRHRHRASRQGWRDSHPRRRSRAGQGDFSPIPFMPT